MEHFEEREWDLALRSRLAVALEGQPFYAVFKGHWRIARLFPGGAA